MSTKYRRSVGACDVYYHQVSLLLHCDGANNSTTFTDSSPSPKTVTAVGNGKLTTTSPKFGSACGNFAASGDYITVPANAAFNFGTGDWTIEFWVKSTNTARCDPAWQNAISTTTGNWELILNNISSGSMEWWEGNFGKISATGTGWNDGNWHHHAITRSGNSVRMFLDGVQKGSTYTTSYTYGSSSVGVVFSTDGQSHTTAPILGQMDEIRITKGVARYTANFTPPARPFYNR